MKNFPVMPGRYQWGFYPLPEPLTLNAKQNNSISVASECFIFHRGIDIFALNVEEVGVPEQLLSLFMRECLVVVACGWIP